MHNRIKVENSTPFGTAIQLITGVVLVAIWLAPTQVVAAQTEPLSGKQVVDTTCARCHATGVDGAPRIGDAAAWKARTGQGLTSLSQHALTGIRKMPSHGGNPGLSDIDIKRAITYMVNQSGGHWIEPAGSGAAYRERSGEQIVNAQCHKCHEAGLNGAPRIGDLSAWAPRFANGVDVLVRSAIRGHGGMPPRGGMADLTDAEIRSAAIYMLLKGAAPAAAAATAPAPATGPAPSPAKPTK